MGRDPDFPDRETPQSSRRGSIALPAIKLYVTIETSDSMAWGAGKVDAALQPAPGNSNKPPTLLCMPLASQSPVFPSLPLLEYVPPEADSNATDSERSLRDECRSKNLPFVRNQPVRIPGLYPPIEQPISMLIFGSLYHGRFDPSSRLECFSEQLYEKLRENWAEDVPAAILPLHFPYNPEGPAAVYLSRKNHCAEAFVLGQPTKRRFETSATRAIEAEVACAARQGLNSDNLAFLQQSLTFCDFQVIQTSVLSPCRLQSGQKLLHMKGTNRLIAAARAKVGLPAEIVAITVSSDDDDCLRAQLATIAFRESIAKSDEIAAPSEAKVKLLVVTRRRDLEATVDEIKQSVPKDIAMHVLTANMPTVRYDSSRKYDSVLEMLALLDADPGGLRSRL